MNVSRYTDTTELKFEIEFITPTFLGGADGNAEIRTAPFKHGIRYWWRVLYGAKYGDKIKETENLIFGSTEKASNIQIMFSDIPRINLVEKIGFPKGKKVSVSHSGRIMNINILDYLAYGKYEYVRGSGNVYQSTYIKPKTKLNFIVTIKNVGYTEEIKDAIKFFILYGGVGSRSRNGFGSMSANLASIEFSKSVNLLNMLDFPVFSKEAHFYRTKKTFNTWEDALSEIGEIYKNARCNLENQHKYEKRGLISRPIEVKGETIDDNIRKDRIPKPFYLGIKKYEDQFLGYILCLPINFYEKNKQKDYMEQIKKMNEEFSKKLKDDTEIFLKQFTGGTSK